MAESAHTPCLRHHCCSDTRSLFDGCSNCKGRNPACCRVEVADCHQCPAGWKWWSVRSIDENVIVEIPDRRLARRVVEQRVIGMAITVEVCYVNQRPAAYIWQRRTEGAAQVDVVIQIPNSRDGRKHGPRRARNRDGHHH